ncbi:UGSC family (seleno)protein [Conexibacter sp. CPCC 206217]|uniref:UGSC family (seleno)protein n=1 Tax=Conexibacter sp. CPCC 206217 TaxID=3064574 RepID=UPI002717F2D2|nr:UGSC family (seleno)protein [Conexibacter sp. CPCC 206217]MDO8208873.1 UGSC family (seleno)protein [Conexibacter sp. CPCC 206217]
MSLITVLTPDEHGPAAAETIALAERSALPRRPVIGLVVNGKPLADELMHALADELGQRLGRPLEVVLVRKPSAGHQLADDVADALAQRADWAIAGLGDCGACSTCSLYDAVMLERRGVPATVLITEPFQTLIASIAAKLGAPGYHSIAVPHPVWGKDEAQLRSLARPVAATAVTQLLAPLRGGVAAA